MTRNPLTTETLPFANGIRIRGRIISVQQCFINLGILVAFFIQYGTSHIDGQAAWRLPIGLQMIVRAPSTIAFNVGKLTSTQATITLHFTMYFLPESPRWLVQNDRQEEALAALARLHANGDVDDPYVRAELSEITAKIAWEKRNPPPSYSQMLFGGEARRTWLGIGVVRSMLSICSEGTVLTREQQFWQQVTGVNV
jgi:hypothetical protein